VDEGSYRITVESVPNTSELTKIVERRSTDPGYMLLQTEVG